MSLWLTLTGCPVLLGYTVWSRRRAVLLPLVLLSLTALPARAQTSGFVLAQGPGKLVDSLIAAGYGNYNVYDTLVSIQQSTDPSISGVLTNAFLATLQSCPANSSIFTNKLSSYAGSGVLINANCTAVATGLQGSGFNGLAGTTTLATVISGVSAPAAVVSSTTSSPLYALLQGGIGVCQPGGPSCSSVFGIAYAPQGSSQSFVLSNEAPGQLISKLVAAGYGNFNLYETLQAVRAEADPSISGLLTDAFLTKVAGCPAGSQVFTIQLRNVAGPAVAVSDDCSVQNRNLRGSAFNGQPGTTTLVTDISGVGSASLVSSTSSNPLTSWNQVITVGSGTATVTYNAFAILYTPGSTPPVAPAPALSPVALVLMGGLLPLAGYWHLRSRIRRGKCGPGRCGVSD